MVYSREQFLKDNPDKTITIEKFYGNSDYGCHSALCTYRGDWTIQELVNYVDNSTGNYGGRIDNEIKNRDGSSTGTITIYYD